MFSNASISLCLCARLLCQPLSDSYGFVDRELTLKWIGSCIGFDKSPQMGESSCESMRQKKSRMAMFSTWEADTREDTHTSAHTHTHTQAYTHISQPLHCSHPPYMQPSRVLQNHKNDHKNVKILKGSFAKKLFIYLPKSCF